jgi:hypothetical protein
MPNYPPLQLINAAVYSRLSGDATLTTTLGAAVVNDEAEDQAHPFVLVPGAGAQPWNTLGLSYGWQCELTPVVFSRYEGDLEAIQIAERVIALLNDYAFTVTGYQTVICEVDPDWNGGHWRFGSRSRCTNERRAPEAVGRRRRPDRSAEGDGRRHSTSVECPASAGTGQAADVRRD